MVISSFFLQVCLNSPDVFLKLTLTGHEQNALHVFEICASAFDNGWTVVVESRKMDFEPPHDDEGGVNLPVKCSCFELIFSLRLLNDFVLQLI